MHDCKQNEVIRELCEFKGSTEKAVVNIERSIKNIEVNHLAHIYIELKKIGDRPSWLVTGVVSLFLALVALLIRELIARL